MHKNWHFFDSFNTNCIEKGWKMGDIQMTTQKINVQKIAIFFEFTIQLHCKVGWKWDICGRCARRWLCTKIAIFFKFRAIFNRVCIVAAWIHGTIGAHVSPDVQPLAHIGSHTSCTKIAKNWHFFGKKAEFPRKWAILGKIMGDMRAAQKLQKIAVFLRKLLKIGGFERFSPKSWDICGISAETSCVRNLRAKRRTYVHSAQAAAHYARAQPHAAATLLLRRDVFALKICAHYAPTALRAF